MAIERLYEPVFQWRYFQVLTDYLAVRCGQVWLDKALLEAGIAANLGAEQESAIPIAQVEIFLQRCLQQLAHGELVFEWGKRIALELEGPLVWALQHCKTLEQCLQLGARHHHLISTHFSWIYQRTREFGELILRPSAPISREGFRVFMELPVIATRIRMTTLLHERIPAYDVYFPFERPPHAARYAELRPMRAHFGAQALPEMHMVFPLEALSRPLDRSEGEVDEAALRALSTTERSTLRNHWSGWVLTMLREANGCQPTQELLAEMLSVSPHTLARRLADEGYRFRDMARAMRHRRACEMLTQTQFDVTEIAHRLGYTSVSNFCNAFRAEAGVSPGAYRKQAATP